MNEYVNGEIYVGTLLPQVSVLGRYDEKTNKLNDCHMLIVQGTKIMFEDVVHPAFSTSRFDTSKQEAININIDRFINILDISKIAMGEGLKTEYIKTVTGIIVNSNTIIN